MTKLGDRGRQLRRSVRALLAGSLCGASLAPVAALAQEGTEAQGAANGDVESEVVVTAFRKSLAVSLDEKRKATGAVDVIVAEDIADFPDLNIAESIQRVPGVAITRDAGEGRQISVRGLSAEFTRVRINGIEAMSANGGTDAAGGTNRGRSFDFNTFASELFNQITIRKTSSASTEEGSLGATVDLRSARPFDYEGMTLVTSLQGGYNEISEDINPRGAFLVSNTFADGKFGALISLAYTERSLLDEGASTVRWQRAGTLTGGPGFSALAPNYTGSPTLQQINLAFVPRIPRYDIYEHDQDRLGLTTSLQFQPTDSTLINVDGLYAEFNAERTETFLEVPNFSAGISGMTVSDAVIDDTNTLVYGVFNNVDIRSEHRFDELKTEFLQVTLDGTQEIGERVRVNGLLGFAESNHENPVQTTLLLDWNNFQTMSYDYRGDRRLPVISYTGGNLMSDTAGTPQTGGTSTVNSGGWYLSQVRLRPQSSINSIQTYAGDLQFDVADSITLSAGGSYKDFTFKTTELRRSNGTITNQETIIPTLPPGVTLADITHGSAISNGLDVPFGTTSTFLIPDVPAATDLLALDDRSVWRMGPEPALNNNRTVHEIDKGAFVQADFNFPLGPLTLRGNAGVRYVETDLTASGFSFLSGAPQLVVAERSYNDTLPSMSLALDLTEQLIVRLSAAKVMSRPDIGNLNPGGTVTVSGNNRNVTTGNPAIDPTRARTYDGSVEWYFDDESLLGLALFYKDIKSRPESIALTNQVYTGNPLGLPNSLAIAACGNLDPSVCSPDLPIWNFNSTVNGKGGHLKGFEVTYQQPFGFLPGFLGNFGTILNFTAVESKIRYLDPNTNEFETANLTGLSDRSYNATLYYETDRFSARISGAYRSDYNTRLPGQNGNTVEATAETFNLDAAASFNLTDSIEFTLEALNLTDEFQDQWVDFQGDRPSFYHHPGREYFVGARVRF
jgi:iron complex outermembrane receptor protein